MLQLFLVLAIILAVALIAYTLAFRADYEVSRSLLIAAPKTDVFRAVADLRQWPSWSPWLMHEPGCTLTYSEEPPPDGVGGHYQWDGKWVGAGKMTTVSTDNEDGIVQRLDFVRPFASTAQVSWSFKEQDGGTMVTWSMASRMPYLFRFMTKMVVRMIGDDYDLGLSLLRRKLDESSLRFEIEFNGVSEQPARRCAFTTVSGGRGDHSQAVSEAIARLRQAAGDGEALVTYLTWSDQAQQCDIEVAVATDRDDCGEFAIKQYPASTCNKTILRGDLGALGNAWQAAVSNTRICKLKPQRRRWPFEVHKDEDGKKWVCLLVPVKG